MNKTPSGLHSLGRIAGKPGAGGVGWSLGVPGPLLPSSSLPEAVLLGPLLSLDRSAGKRGRGAAYPARVALQELDLLKQLDVVRTQAV